MATTTVNININGYESLGELEFEHPQLENLDNLVTKDELNDLATKKDLEGFITQGDTAFFVKRNELDEYARLSDIPDRVGFTGVSNGDYEATTDYTQYLKEVSKYVTISLSKPDSRGYRAGRTTETVAGVTSVYSVQATPQTPKAKVSMGITSVYVDERNDKAPRDIGLTVVTTMDVDEITVYYKAVGMERPSMAEHEAMLEDAE